MARSRVRGILNPSAHSGRARRVLRGPLAEVPWSESESPEHLQELVRAAQDDELDALLLAGGDGTVTLAANALAEPNPIPLALVPVGSGNDFARDLGIARPGKTPWTLLAAGVPRRVDVARVVGGPRYCCVASVGFDARALEIIHGSWFSRSKLLNTWASLRALWTVPPAELRVSWEGGEFAGRAMLAAVTNTRGYGGGFLLSPEARLDDGRLDLCIIGDIGRARMIAQFPRIFAGTHGDQPGVLLASSPWVRIEHVERSYPVCLDGELAGGEQTPVELRCEPEALHVLALPEEAA